MSDYNLTLFETCELLNRSKKSISRYIRRDLLHPQQIKSQQGTLEYRFSESDLKAFKENENQTRQDRVDTPDRTDETGQEKATTPLPSENAEKVLAEAQPEQTRQDTGDRTDQTGHIYIGANKPTPKKEVNVSAEPTTEETGHHTPEETRQDTEIINLLKETTGLLKDQLKVKDEQIKDLGGKIDQLIERDRETNILLKGLQDKVLMLEQPKPEGDQTGQGRGDGTGQDEPKPAKERFWKRLF